MSQTITLPQVNAYTLGQLLYFFEMATAYAGELLDVDALTGGFNLHIAFATGYCAGRAAAAQAWPIPARAGTETLV